MILFPDIGMVLDLVVLLFLLFTAIAVLFSRDLMVAVILLCAFSLLMAVQYLVLEAPDVAITEAAVGAGISTILLLLTLSLTGDKPRKVKKPLSVLPVIIVFLTGLALLYATLSMPGFGLPDAPSQVHIAPYFLEKTMEEIGIPNVVTAILASYRGFDTFGETVVILTAAICVLLLLDTRTVSLIASGAKPKKGVRLGHKIKEKILWDRKKV